MKIAYLIAAFKHPLHLKRLIDALSVDDCGFFIHVDKKSDIGDFRSINWNNVAFCDRRTLVYWSEYSFVEAQLALMRQSISSPRNYDYFILLSGSEYPLRSGRYIADFFGNNQGWEFISLAKMPHDRKPISRISTFRVSAAKPVRRTIVKGLARLGLARRDYMKYLGALEPFAGNTWWALTRDACRYILDFVQSNRPVCEFFENIFAPDETLFHTILGNSIFRPRVRRNLVFEDWRWCVQARQAGRRHKYKFLERSGHKSAHPAWMEEEHVGYFEKSGKVLLNDIYGSGEALFARKFREGDTDLIRRMENVIRNDVIGHEEGHWNGKVGTGP
ncbi:MAG: hypothetical protein M0Z58_03950 [Nitrospiraceae bacterium]|nr:hypothetical protein [Nitrospiraceae bacterium]